MRIAIRSSIVVGLLMVALTVARASAPSEARAVIDKAIKAMGGRAKLAKYRAVTFKDKGKFYVMDRPVPFSGEGAIQAPDQFRETVVTEMSGMKFLMVRAINGDRGWVKQNDEVREMDKETLALEKEQLYAAWVTKITPLQNKEFELTLLGESQVDGRSVVGVKVFSKGHQGINLYFDKGSGLLLKSVMRVKDLSAGGKEIDLDVFYEDYKEVDGTQQPMKFIMKREGKTFFELEFSDFQLHEKLADSYFEKL